MTVVEKSCWLMLVLLFCVFGLVRVIALNADPPASLSWSTGIYTDEGIYAGDARSVAFTGHWMPGDFHSAIISPLLHLIQLGVFKSLGVGLMQVRLISVVFGLATLILFYAGLHSIYDQRTAMIGVIFLGLSVPFVLYNRLALLETPALFVLVAAYFVLARQGSIFLAGLLLGLAFVFKPLALLAAPAFLCSMWPDRGNILKLSGGLATTGLIYALIWYLPNHVALTRMNSYYAFHQYLPHTMRGCVHNLRRGLWTGEGDGILPYMVKHEFFLTLLSVASLVRVRWTVAEDRLLAIWLLTPVIVFLFISYTPSRYFVLIWPPLAALAARTLATSKDSYAAGMLSLFVVVCFAQLFGLWQQRTYSVLEDGTLLPQLIADRTMVAGQFAPELCLSNHLVSLYVQPGLANDEISTLLQDNDAAVLVTRSRYWDSWWQRKSPKSFRRDSHRSFTVGSAFVEDVYSWQ